MHPNHKECTLFYTCFFIQINYHFIQFDVFQFRETQHMTELPGETLHKIIPALNNGFLGNYLPEGT